MNAPTIRPAVIDDLPLVLRFIRDLADYERLAHEVLADEDKLRASLFGPRPFAEVLLAFLDDEPAGFAVFFHNYSTFLAQPGIYLEDLFVRPQFRGQGIGRLLLTRLAQIATDRRCGRMEWSALDWNETAIRFYLGLGAKPNDEWTTYRLTGDALSQLASGSPVG
jgi:GNAT superfamily N-acetyltransferase